MDAIIDWISGRTVCIGGYLIYTMVSSNGMLWAIYYPYAYWMVNDMCTNIPVLS